MRERALGRDGIPEVYERVAPAIVGITCAGPSGGYFGTGTIVDPGGLAVTSTTVVPRDAREIRVYLRGARVLPARLVLADDADELALVAIQGAPGERFPSLELGDSGALRVGDVALTFGNAFRSIETDDQVSLGVGIVSGFSVLEETFSQSKYNGPAIEITAPLNSGADGGPLIDVEGRFVGILCLNYSRSRWLGTAVPLSRFRHLLQKHLSVFDERWESFGVYAGFGLELGADGAILVREVSAGGPAAQAGLAEGDAIREIGGRAANSLDDVRAVLGGARPGALLRLKVRRRESSLELEIRPWGRF